MKDHAAPRCGDWMRRVGAAKPSFVLMLSLQFLFLVALWSMSSNSSTAVSDSGRDERKVVTSVSENSCFSGYEFVPCDATMKEMRYEYFDCGPREDTVRPLLNESERMLMRGLYHGIVGPDRSTIGGFPSFGNGFNVAITDLQHESHGRSIWAQEDVIKGTLVWTSEGQTACFPEGHLWRQFILSLPRYLVCDGMAFSYMAVKFLEHQEYNEDRSLLTREKKEKVMVCTDTDEGAFLNDGGYDDHDANVGCPPGSSKKECHYGLKMYALRDIKKGEEILCSYDSFWVPKGWEAMGL
mmetsp:Transcript_20460/g.33907  ORF Transcript_20460/g.33907 Transcript_20460/m.33907 type:complete len:296 (+) Transcript_20460:70-957(+)|eukprot:CAMPEP_0119012206 /NCGR_PEP_ID=MMETSP1176-20130426/6147_1 /TAXON_ID=265551 /ORGANISM="Synedropsis recta cf, Strain CCMP1620" /LENGTH=295 /DNA_ID=CAMNT_0006965125 /DNA_START=34 /DNA_END=924 /DNA_ORIENTATION=-